MLMGRNVDVVVNPTAYVSEKVLRASIQVRALLACMLSTETTPRPPAQLHIIAICGGTECQG